ncbi:hypothetical protein [Rhizobium sp. 21-4511-3d]
MEDLSENQKQVALAVVTAATPSENQALRSWLSELLTIRNSKTNSISKAKQALTVTAQSKVIWPVIQIIAKQVKKRGWDDRSKSQRFGIGGVAVGVALFGGQSAGIAALGTAVGVPLWVVLGAGSMFAQHLYSELVGSATAPEARSQGGDETDGKSYKTIDLKRADYDN